MSALLSVRNLSVSFDGGLSTVVREVGFDVAAGECVALVGESGSGKSVTARALLGVAGRHSHVAADELRWRHTDLLGLDERGWRTVRGAGIGLVLQDALGSLDPLRQIGAEVGEARAVHGIGTAAERPAAVRRLLHEVGIPEPALRAKQYRRIHSARSIRATASHGSSARPCRTGRQTRADAALSSCYAWSGSTSGISTGVRRRSPGVSGSALRSRERSAPIPTCSSATRRYPPST